MLILSYADNGRIESLSPPSIPYKTLKTLCVGEGGWRISLANHPIVYRPSGGKQEALFFRGAGLAVGAEEKRGAETTALQKKRNALTPYFT